MSKKLTIGLFALLFIVSGVQSLAISRIQKSQEAGNTNVVSLINSTNTSQQAAVGLYNGVTKDLRSSKSQGYVVYYDSTGGLRCAYLSGGFIYTGGTPQGYGDVNDINKSYDCISVTDTGTIDSNTTIDIINKKNVEIAGADEVLAFKAIADKLKLENKSEDTGDLIKKINESVLLTNYHVDDSPDPEDFPWLCRERVGNDSDVPTSDSSYVRPHWHYFACRVRISLGFVIQ